MEAIFCVMAEYMEKKIQQFLELMNEMRVKCHVELHVLVIIVECEIFMN